MGLESVRNGMLTVGRALDKHAPEILTGVSCVGFAMSIVMAVKKTPEAVRLLDEKAFEKMKSYGDEESVVRWEENERRFVDPTYYFEILQPTEILAATWRCYTPMVVMAGLSIGGILVANHVNSSRNIALAGAYSMIERNLENYQKKVVDILGEEKNEEIREEIAKDELAKTPFKGDPMIVANNGEHLVFDSITGRYFRSDKETIRSAMNDFNQELIGGVYMDLNEWYRHLCVPPIKIGDDVGWNSDRLLEIKFAGAIAENGEPCIVLDYYSLPKASFKYGM